MDLDFGWGIDRELTDEGDCWISKEIEEEQ